MSLFEISQFEISQFEISQFEISKRTRPGSGPVAIAAQELRKHRGAAVS